MDNSQSSDGGSCGDIPTRPMRVKVLYTFDTDAKTSCLARLPDTQNIPVVAIDEQSHVGVIDLQQCIQAIVSASPEILSKLESGDFTVYNFDFTEVDTPIVGQGRLSALLAGNSSGSQAMITGRVCKNMQALFTNGVKEILEVKFKLTPLSRPVQSDAAHRMNEFRSVSPALSGGFDPNAWNASMQQTRPQQQSNDYFAFDAMASGCNSDSALLDDMFGIESGSSGDISGLQQVEGAGIPETPKDAAFTPNPTFTAHSYSAPGSRAASPIMPLGSSNHNEPLRHQSFSAQSSNFVDHSRPASRATKRSESNTAKPHHTTGQIYQHLSTHEQPEVFYNEDGQARKRAKVTQTDWRGKSSFGSKSSDLRITAATASSMHMFRPIAKRPSAPGADLEPPPRVPTPVPNRTLPPRQWSQQPAGPRSMLRQASTLDSDIASDNESSPGGSSPARSVTAELTPMDFPSSPPLVPGYNEPTPSSPGLPTLPRMADSGYMSERGFTSGPVMESLEDDEGLSPDADGLQNSSHYHSRQRREKSFIKRESSFIRDFSQSRSMDRPIDLNNAKVETPGDMSLLPHTRMPPERRGGSQGNWPMQTVPSNEVLTQPDPATSPCDERAPQLEGAGSRRGSLVLPPKPLSRSTSQDQGGKALPAQRRQPLQRSRTMVESEAGSPAPSDTEGRPRGTARSGSGKHRRQLIEQRLQQAIENGDMPLYCSHCGAVETPTWRKLYVKECDGKPGPLDYAEGEGETIGIQAIEVDPQTGETTKFLTRKSMKKTKDLQPGKGFEETTVCNPCGLWFTKYRKMRPEDKWQKKSGTRRTRSRCDDGPATEGTEPPSDACFTDQIVPEDAVEDSSSTEFSQANSNTHVVSAAQVPRPRASSMQPESRRSSENSAPNMSRHGAVMRREVQSSPVRFGSQDSPIEVDLTPGKPTRRLLFPSPRQAGEMKSLEGKAGSVSPPGDGENLDVNVYEVFMTDKENMAPGLKFDDDLSHLFEGSPSIFKTPLLKTPSKKTPSSSKHMTDLLKTPTQSSRKRKALAPTSNGSNGGNVNGNDFMTSPGSARYFLRSTPSRLERTPGGRSIHGSGSGTAAEPSPFSRHLAQMLSDATGIGDAPFTSPSRQYDFSDLPTFGTPGREVDWKGLDEILSSEFASFETGGVEEA